MLDEVDKLEDQVSQQELLQYEMERELMKRSPRAKLMRRSSELEQLDFKLKEVTNLLIERQKDQ
jgi:hypothetical protein